ncbi:unnamed protein product [Parnassius apollo]|uniref:(apollo) hypothetical protein n=1 Tax=Parnassius apollo TaxID=110799 RepID=A0A8S3X2H9_PARAO|nr:unnamed protein product [Parnassius apollo]
MHYLILLAFFATAHARAVNISNTWVLPEEGFPVFYRYFRDRISWYEADAVCQFHHANLVTVDTTAQYDAVRAYLKELDISSAVWVGLIRSNPEGEFTWTDYRGLSSDGYWSSAPDPRIAPLCAAADPGADYRWEARTCGGPTVASFICELPVPQWALGNEGCMVRALPALTILYLPESAAVQLTADCGLAGVKRIQCIGNMKREDLLKDLSCTEEVELSSPSNNLSINNNNNITTDITVIGDSHETTSIIPEEKQIINNEDDDNQLANMISTPSHLDQITLKSVQIKMPSTTHQILGDNNNLLMRKDINLDVMENNNLQSNDIPNLVNNNNFLTNYRIEKMEDEENMQHKKLHDELARLGNFETIFTQPTDHFVPPLVIAKAKLSDDMNVLSFEEKHAKLLNTHNSLKNSNEQNGILSVKNKLLITTEQPNLASTFNSSGLSTEKAEIRGNELKKENAKNALPKKYINKDFDSNITSISKEITKKEKVKINKNIDNVLNKSNQSFVYTYTNLNETSKLGTTTENYFDVIQNDDVIDLTVTLRDVNRHNDSYSTIPSKNDEIDMKPLNNITESESSNIDVNVKNNSQLTSQNSTFSKYVNIDEVVLQNKIINSSMRNESSNFSPQLDFDVATKTPIFKDDFVTSTVLNNPINADAYIEIEKNNVTDNTYVDISTATTQSDINSITIVDMRFTTLNYSLSVPISTATKADSTKASESTGMNTESSPYVYILNKSDIISKMYPESRATYVPIANDIFNITEGIEDTVNNSSNLETIDDFQSPLLSGASEPLQRPNRSRRPKQTLNRINKFNPFRILG